MAKHKAPEVPDLMLDEALVMVGMFEVRVEATRECLRMIWSDRVDLAIELSRDLNRQVVPNSDPNYGKVIFK